MTALRVNARGATLVETPVLPSSSNLAARTWKATVAADGSAKIEEEVRVMGQAAPEWREHYQTPGERQDRFAKVWNARFPGTTLESVTIDGAEDRNRPVVARSLVEVPRLAEPLGAEPAAPGDQRPRGRLRPHLRPAVQPAAGVPDGLPLAAPGGAAFPAARWLARGRACPTPASSSRRSGVSGWR